MGERARRLDPPGRGGPRRDARLLHEGLLPGQEPVARLGTAGRSTASLRVLESRTPPGDEVRHDGKVVGRVTSAVPGLALAYVRVEVSGDAELAVGASGKTARTLPA